MLNIRIARRGELVKDDPKSFYLGDLIDNGSAYYD